MSLRTVPESEAAAQRRFQGATDGRFTGLTEANERAWRGDWSFVVMADTQFGMLDGKYPASGETWDTERQMAERCVKHINRLEPKPKFVVVCGDLVDAMPYDQPLQQRQIAGFRHVFSRVDPSIALVCVCGNHDVGDIPCRESVQQWRSRFGDDYFAFWCGGCRFIVLDSQLITATVRDTARAHASL